MKNIDRLSLSKKAREKLKEILKQKGEDFMPKLETGKKWRIVHMISLLVSISLLFIIFRFQISDWLILIPMAMFFVCVSACAMLYSIWKSSFDVWRTKVGPITQERILARFFDVYPGFGFLESLGVIILTWLLHLNEFPMIAYTMIGMFVIRRLARAWIKYWLEKRIMNYKLLN